MTGRNLSHSGPQWAEDQGLESLPWGSAVVASA